MNPAEQVPVAAPLAPHQVNPKKLALSKWTAVAPRNKEKHFLVTQVVAPLEPSMAIETVELEAINSGRRIELPWRELTNPLVWRQGWK
jgi:tryptophan-rich hypothetical protein